MQQHELKSTALDPHYYHYFLLIRNMILADSVLDSLLLLLSASTGDGCGDDGCASNDVDDRIFRSKYSTIAD